MLDRVKSHHRKIVEIYFGEVPVGGGKYQYFVIRVGGFAG